MKLFAVNLLAERLDRPTFTAIDPRDVEYFTKTLCYIIQREIDIVSHTDYNFKSLAKDGLFGKSGKQINVNRAWTRNSLSGLDTGKLKGAHY